MKGDDLPFGMLDLVPNKVAVHQQTAATRYITLADDVLVAGDVLNHYWQGREQIGICFRKEGYSAKTSDQARMGESCCHPANPLLQARFKSVGVCACI